MTNSYKQITVKSDDHQDAKLVNKKHKVSHARQADDSFVAKLARILEYVPVHGNWVGPGYSAGERVQGELGPEHWNVQPVDYVDTLAREHDFDYQKMPQFAADMKWLLSSDVSKFRTPGDALFGTTVPHVWLLKALMGYRSPDIPLVGVEENPGPIQDIIGGRYNHIFNDPPVPTIAPIRHDLADLSGPRDGAVSVEYVDPRVRQDVINRWVNIEVARSNALRDQQLNRPTGGGQPTVRGSGSAWAAELSHFPFGGSNVLPEDGGHDPLVEEEWPADVVVHTPPVSPVFPPEPMLVGVEPNPGPPKKGQKNRE